MKNTEAAQKSRQGIYDRCVSTPWDMATGMADNNWNRQTAHLREDTEHIIDISATVVRAGIIGTIVETMHEV